MPSTSSGQKEWRGGSFKNPEEQKRRFEELDEDESIIVYCGSGVTATPNYLALKLAGYEHVKLYAGSYSDWASYGDNPVGEGRGTTMRHKMMLQPDPLEMIMDGRKTIELRLNDTKRQRLQVGDEILFTSTEDDSEKLAVKIRRIHRFPSFKELYAALPLEQLGYAKGEAADPVDMEAYYSLDRQKAYGVLGIEIEVLH